MSSVLSSLLNLPHQLSFVGGAAMVLVGVFLRVRLPRFAMNAEEYVKNRRMTEDQARHRMTMLNVLTVVTIIGGLGACLIVVLA